MRAIVLAINCLVLLSIATDLVRSADTTMTTKKWGIKPARGGVAPGNFAGQSFNNGKNVEGNADKASLNTRVDAQGAGTLNAGRVGKTEVVQVSFWFFEIPARMRRFDCEL